MGVFVILKISPGPSFPKGGLRVSTEKSEEPKNIKQILFSQKICKANMDIIILKKSYKKIQTMTDISFYIIRIY